ncbi:MAG: hypothetical protein ABW321_18635 [Polyangiales bacterium]
MGDLGKLETLTLGPGWEAFTRPEQYLHFALVLLAATASGALLAFHPVHRGRPVTLDDVEQRKTLVLYSSVGALIATICTVAPSMAFVIFGIGGLMRFRTNTGESTATGHTIMGTLIGLCWGLSLQLVAVLATLYFWLMIYFLESARIERLLVTGVSQANWPRAAEAYTEALTKAGCRVLSHNRNSKKDQLVFTVHFPRSWGSEDVGRAVAHLPPELRGFDWLE